MVKLLHDIRHSELVTGLYKYGWVIIQLAGAYAFIFWGIWDIMNGDYLWCVLGWFIATLYGLCAYRTMERIDSNG